MREVPPIDDLARLREAVREELAVRHEMSGVHPNEQWLNSLTDTLVARIDYGFAVVWKPKWVKPGDPHVWTEGAEEFVECLGCGRTTAHPTRQDGARWYREHMESEHRDAATT